MELLISSLYFILPAYFANMGPIVGNLLRLPGGIPISKNLLGFHKTWRGFYMGYFLALLVLWLQYYIQTKGIFETYNLLNYENINLFLYAGLFGIGALTGDAVKSFFKRKLGIKPGGQWFPFDQLDFVIGTLIFLSPFFIPEWQTILTLIIITPILHLLTNVAAYKLKIKKVWW